MKIKKTLTVITLFIFLISSSLGAQKALKNNAFEDGEKLTYDLYYKYGILNLKGGKATLNTETTTYNGENAYKMTLYASTRGIIGNFFSVDDTLTSYMDKNLVPQLFVKGADEGGDYTRERHIYSYKNGKTSIRTIRYKNEEFRFDEVINTNRCTYDMMSVLAFARTLD